MKGQIILILILGFFTLTLNYAFSDLGLDNEIEWEERSKINWEDFRGEIGTFPKRYVGTNDPNAVTTTHIEANWNIREVNSIVCQFQITAISATGVFEKNNSWVHENEKTDYLLEHEQGHFDISEIAAKIFEQAMLYKIFPCPSENYSASQANSIIRDIIENTQININMQRNYDIETNGGKIESIQKHWNLKIKTDLAGYSPFVFNFSSDNDFISKYTKIIYGKQVECISGWEIIEKYSGGKFVCVTPGVALILLERNWGRIP